MADFDGADTSDEEEDEEFVDGETDTDDDLDLEHELDGLEIYHELRDLRADNMRPQDDGFHSTVPLESHTVKLYEDKLTSLRMTFPTAPVSEYERAFNQCNANSKKAYSKLRKLYEPVMTVGEMSSLRRCLAPLALESVPVDLHKWGRLTSIRLTFPTAPISECERVLIECNVNSKKAYDRLRKLYEPRRTVKEMKSLRRGLASLASELRIGISDATDHNAQDDARTTAREHVRFSVHGVHDRHGHGSEQLHDTKTSGDHLESDLGESQFAPEITASETGSWSDGEERFGGNDGEHANMSDSDKGDITSDDDSDGTSNDSDSGSEDTSMKDAASIKRPLPARQQLAKGMSATAAHILQDSMVEESADTNESSAGSNPGSDSSLTTSDDSSGSESESDDASSASRSISILVRGQCLATGLKKLSGANEPSITREPLKPNASPGTKKVSGPVEALKPEELARCTERAGASKFTKLKNTSMPEESGNMDYARYGGGSTHPSSVEMTESSGPSEPVLSKTQKRNLRRRAEKKAKNLRGPSHDTLGQPSAAGDPEFLARKQALLDTIASPSGHHQDHVIKMEPTDSSTGNLASFISAPNVSIPGTNAQSSPSSQSRLRLNVTAGRRMVFGALGLRNPKTKDDEEKVRAALMKDVRPLLNPRTLESTNAYPQDIVVQYTVQDDAEAWREKIAYRAIECCQDGIELSEPPFPFVQRWDPRQAVMTQGKKRRRGENGKRKQRSQADYYQDDMEDESGTKRRRFKEQGEGGEKDQYLDDSFYDEIQHETSANGGIALGYVDMLAPARKKNPIGYSQLTQATDLDDLPPLPKDLGSLADLRPGDAKRGMVVTWKELVASAATRWQPEHVNLTGLVVDVGDEMSDVQVVLAKRDRIKKKFDDLGNRVYDGFDAPDDSDGEDDGNRTVSHNTMIEPRILQQPLLSNLEDQPQDHVPVSEPIPVTNQNLLGDIHTAQGMEPAIREEQLTSLSPDDSGRVVETTTLQRGAQAVTSQESIISETNAQETTGHLGSTQISQADLMKDLTISGNSRLEISTMITVAEDLTPSIANGDPSVSSSASNQHVHMPGASAVEFKAPSRSLSRLSVASSRRSFLAQFDGTMDDPDVPPPTTWSPRVEGPGSDLPFSTGSVSSGRQPDPEFILDMWIDSSNRFDDTAGNSAQVVDTRRHDDQTSQRQHEQEDSQDVTPTPRRSSRTPRRVHMTPPEPPALESSLPPLDDIFSTARMSRNTPTPSVFVVHESVDQRDLEHQEAISQLHEEEELSQEKLVTRQLGGSEMQVTTGKLPEQFGGGKPTTRNLLPTGTRPCTTISRLSSGSIRESEIASQPNGASKFQPTVSLPVSQQHGGSIGPPAAPSRPQGRSESQPTYTTNRNKKSNSKPPRNQVVVSVLTQRACQLSPSQPSQSRRVTRSSGSQFQVPAGSQVVSLLSSSPARSTLSRELNPEVAGLGSDGEPEFVEDYADDSIDETYQDSRGLPVDSDWVKKVDGHKRSPYRSAGTPTAVTKPISRRRATASQEMDMSPAPVEGPDPGIAAKPVRRTRRTSARI